MFILYVGCVSYIYIHVTVVFCFSKITKTSRRETAGAKERLGLERGREGWIQLEQWLRPPGKKALIRVTASP